MYLFFIYLNVTIITAITVVAVAALHKENLKGVTRAIIAAIIYAFGYWYYQANNLAAWFV